MVCPSCSTPLPETGLQCPQCGAGIGWYIGKPNGQIYGPLDRQTLDQCIREARLVAGDSVRLGEEGDFIPAHEVLSQGLAPPPAPAAPVRAHYRAAAAAGGGGAVVAKGCGIAVVICVVLGLLLFLLSIPIMRRNKVASANASCQSNLKQLALGCLMYVQDYDERFPPDADWATLIDPYIMNRQLHICPAATNEKGYVRNPRLSDANLATVQYPAQTFLWWDAGVPVPGTTPSVGATSPRHSGQDNFAYVDGHVRANNPSALAGHLDPAGPGGTPTP